MRAQIALVWALLLAGCSPKSQAPQEVAFQIMVPQMANDNTPFYFVAGHASVAQFYMNDYQKVADMTFSENGGELTKEVLIPGRIQTVRVPIKDPAQPVAAYFLFTTPSEEWKIILDNPDYRHYKIQLGKSDIRQAHGY